MSIAAMIAKVKASKDPLTTALGLVVGFLLANHVTLTDIQTWIAGFTWDTLYSYSLAFLAAWGGWSIGKEPKA